MKRASTSPRRNPRAVSPAASRSTPAASCPYVSARPLGPSISAGWSARSAAPASTKRCSATSGTGTSGRSEEHTSELQSLAYLVCRLLLEKKKKKQEADYDTERLKGRSRPD